MDVVGHQHISMDGEAVGVGGILQTVEIEVKVVLCSEGRLAIVTALDDVQRLARDEEAGQAGYELWSLKGVA